MEQTMVPFRPGVNTQLEAMADELLYAVTITLSKQSDKADILTPWKQENRRSHEVYNSTGIADPATRLGMFHRPINTVQRWLNSRDGVAQVGGLRRPWFEGTAIEQHYQEFGTLQTGHWDPYLAADVMTFESERESSPYRIQRQLRTRAGSWTTAKHY